MGRETPESRRDCGGLSRGGSGHGDGSAQGSEDEGETHVDGFFGVLFGWGLLCVLCVKLRLMDCR